MQSSESFVLRKQRWWWTGLIQEKSNVGSTEWIFFVFSLPYSKRGCRLGPLMLVGGAELSDTQQFPLWPRTCRTENKSAPSPAPQSLPCRPSILAPPATSRAGRTRMCSERLFPPGAQSCGSLLLPAVPAVSVALFLFLAHRAGPEVVDMAFASPCLGLPTVVTPFARCRVRCWGHCWVCFPGYLSCCRFLDDNQIVTSSGDTTWWVSACWTCLTLPSPPRSWATGKPSAKLLWLYAAPGLQTQVLRGGPVHGALCRWEGSVLNN